MHKQHEPTPSSLHQLRNDDLINSDDPREGFIHLAETLTHIPVFAKALLSGNKKSMKRFNETWINSETMTQVKILTKDVKEHRESGAELDSDLLARIDEGIVMVGALTNNAEQLLAQLSGTPAPPFQKNKAKRKPRKK